MRFCQQMCKNTLPSYTVTCIRWMFIFGLVDCLKNLNGEPAFWIYSRRVSGPSAINGRWWCSQGFTPSGWFIQAAGSLIYSFEFLINGADHHGVLSYWVGKVIWILCFSCSYIYSANILTIGTSDCCLYLEAVIWFTGITQTCSAVGSEIFRWVFFYIYFTLPIYIFITVLMPVKIVFDLNSESDPNLQNKVKQ